MRLHEFQAFPSIARLFRDCVVTEKLDGTNAQVFIGDDGTILAGSRSRWLTPEADNFGFARWVADHAAELASLGPGAHFGEWWGSGIQRRYGLTEKRFSLFNVGRWGEGGNDADKKPDCCHVVPVLYRGPFDLVTISKVALDLGEHGSAASPGFMQPEGIVVWHAAGQVLFKYTLGDDGHKSIKPGVRAGDAGKVGVHMRTYEIGNPSDAYTMHAPDLQTAAAAVLFLGEGHYALTGERDDDTVPILAFSGKEDITAYLAKMFPDGDLGGWVEKHRTAVADALDSVMIGDKGQRFAVDEAMRLLEGPAREEYRAKVHDKRRSSMNDIGGRAWALAKRLREPAPAAVSP